MILKILKLHSPKGLCNFENFQNHVLIMNCTPGRAFSYTNIMPTKKIHVRDAQRNIMVNTGSFRYKAFCKRRVKGWMNIVIWNLLCVSYVQQYVNQVPASIHINNLIIKISCLFSSTFHREDQNWLGQNVCRDDGCYQRWSKKNS